MLVMGLDVDGTELLNEEGNCSEVRLKVAQVGIFKVTHITTSHGLGVLSVEGLALQMEDVQGIPITGMTRGPINETIHVPLFVTTKLQ